MANADGSRKKAQTIKLRAVVDRIEDGDIAVLSIEDEQRTQMDIPASRLPQGTGDGDHLILKFKVEEDGGKRTLVSITVDKNSRAAAAARVKELQEQLEKLSGTAGKKDFKL